MNNAPKNNKDPFANDPKTLALAERIMSLRLQKQISQEDLAQKAGLPQSQISKIERGIIGEPGIWTLADIAKALDTTVEELLKPVEFKHKKTKKLDWDKITQGDPKIFAITSPKGGVGKSSTAMNMAALLSHKLNKGPQDSKPKRVLVIDGDIGNGTLAVRLTGQEMPGLIDLINQMDENLVPEKFEDLRDLCLLSNMNLPDLFVLPAPTDPHVVEDLMVEDYEKILGYLKTFFSVIIIDCGIEMYAAHNQMWLKSADAVFVLTLPEAVSLQKTYKLINYITQPRQTSSPVVYPPLKGLQDVYLVIMRSDVDWGIKEDVKMIVQKAFPKFAKQQIIYFHDVEKAMNRANNKGEFLALSKLSDGMWLRKDIYQMIATILKQLEL